MNQIPTLKQELLKYDYKTYCKLSSKQKPIYFEKYLNRLKKFNINEIDRFLKSKLKYYPTVLERAPLLFDKVVTDINEIEATEKYRSRRGELKHPPHRGQDKLLVQEIQFLALCIVRFYKGKPLYCAYIGAAPGTHLLKLIPLFNGLIRFVLIDPAPIPFNKKLYKMNNVNIIKKCFNDEMANDLAKIENLIVIDDHRNVPMEWKPGKDSNGKTKDDYIRKDIDDFKVWRKIMNPLASLWKMALPYEGDPIWLPDGEIKLVPIVGPTSTEGRMILFRTDKEKCWNVNEFANKFFTFNTKIRNKHYCGNHNVHYEGFCHCWDCLRIIGIINDYLTALKMFPPNSVHPKLKDVYADLQSGLVFNTHVVEVIKLTCGTLLDLHHGSYPTLRDDEFYSQPFVFAATMCIQLRDMGVKDRNYKVANKKSPSKSKSKSKKNIKQCTVCGKNFNAKNPKWKRCYNCNFN